MYGFYIKIIKYKYWTTTFTCLITAIDYRLLWGRFLIGLLCIKDHPPIAHKITVLSWLTWAVFMIINIAVQFYKGIYDWLKQQQFNSENQTLKFIQHINDAICIQTPPNFYEKWECNRHHGWPYLLILSCPFPVLGSLDPKFCVNTK